VNWLTEPLSYEFIRTGLLAAVLVSISCAAVGTHVVARRMSFLGDALAHTMLPGIVIAFLLGASLLGGALVAAVVTVLLIALITRGGRVQEDAAIGVAFTGMFAVGVMLLSTTNSFRDFTHILFGNILGVADGDLVVLGIITGVVLLVLLAFRREFEVTAVDPQHALAIGLRPDRVRMALLLLLAPTIVAGIQAVGVLLTTGLLIVPAAGAFLVTRRFRTTMLVAVLIGVGASLAGVLISYHAGVSTGATIALCACVGFGACLAIAALRGTAATISPKEATE
jgi:ABC-type Mn2+/Zn2+ transport system permease subunit